MGKSPKIVYLDQSRVSEMIKVVRGDDPSVGRPYRDDYVTLYERLKDLVSDETVICPFSFWHAIECVLFNDDIRLEVCAFFDAACQGQAFMFSHDALDKDIYEFVMNQPPSGMLRGFWGSFPVEVVSQLTRDYFEDAGRPFTAVVELIRSDRDFVVSIDKHREEMLASLQGYVEQFHGSGGGRPAMPSVVDIRTSLADDIVRTCMRKIVCSGLSMQKSERAVRRQVKEAMMEGTWHELGIGVVGTWCDVVATRLHQGGKFDSSKKRRGEAFDLAHMTSLPASDIFVMERKYTAIGQNAARRIGTVLVQSPAEAVEALDAF